MNGAHIYNGSQRTSVWGYEPDTFNLIYVLVSECKQWPMGTLNLVRRKLFICIILNESSEQLTVIDEIHLCQSLTVTEEK